MSVVEIESERGCAFVKLNRPERLNALNEELYSELLFALIAAEADPAVRVVVLSGEGRAFCSGADLKAHASGRTKQERLDYAKLGQKVCAQVQEMSTPVVAQVHGFALGGGAEIAVAADFMTIDEDAAIGFPEVTIGTVVTGGVTYKLPRLIGLHKTRELLFLGKRISGAEAANIGLAWRSAPAKELEHQTRSLAEALAKNAPVSIGHIKRGLRDGTSLEDALSMELDALLDIMTTRDWAEGVNAFAQRRPPRFEGK